MRRYSIIAAALFLFTSCTDSCSNSKEITEDEKIPKEVKLKDPSYEVLVESIHMNEFGYKIIKDGEMIINQMNIPAIQGNIGFKSEKDARITGELMLFKIKNGVFPPTLSKEELDSLGILQ